MLNVCMFGCLFLDHAKRLNGFSMEVLILRLFIPESVAVPVE